MAYILGRGRSSFYCQNTITYINKSFIQKQYVMVKCLYPTLFLLFLPLLSSAQIKNVSYRLDFDPSTNLYDCYLHVNEGKTSKLMDRVQLNAQLTFLIPTGASVEVAKNYMPLQDNQKFDGTKPMHWTKANVITKPASDPFHDYVSVVPQLSPTSFYNELKAGDKIKLFSLKINHVDHCGDDIKLFDNKNDLLSTEIGMNGADFRNGFTIGGIQQKYSKNEATITPALDIIQEIKVSVKNGIKVDVTANEDAQYAPYAYEWTTPFGVPVEGKNLKISKPSFAEFGTYQLMVTDVRGCKQLKTVEIQSDATTPVQTWADGNTNQAPESLARNNGEVAQNVTIYPNPASHVFFINLETEIGTKVDLILTDLSGRSVLKTIYSAASTQRNLNIQVPTDDLTAGMYNVLARINGKESLHKVIIVK